MKRTTVARFILEKSSRRASRRESNVKYVI